MGDNPDGNNPDPHLFDSDIDGYDNSEDPLPLKPTPGDKDNDGVADELDCAPDDIRELADFDNDGQLDLYQANGAVSHIPGQTGDPFAEPNPARKLLPFSSRTFSKPFAA